MPYPLENLQYGLRRRLRELATRSEAYAFQIAAPNYYGFQPIQKVRLLTQAVFVKNEENNLEKILYPEQPKNSHEIPLYVVSNKLTFEKFTPDFKLSTILNDFRFEPKYLEFHDCRLDEMFIQSFVNNVTDPIKCVSLCPSSFSSENGAKMLSNSPAFRALESFTVMEPMFPSLAWWIKAFVKKKCTSLKEFNVHFAKLSVFEIDKEVLIKFIKVIIFLFVRLLQN
uniref:DUF38 domain-containing protein n=1 Tax=Panagrellus redivivus TaxID=6233 RepID=A0A7E4WC43_PANRE